MKVTPETCRVDKLWYLRFYCSHSSSFTFRVNLDSFGHQITCRHEV